jgi:hypothetical protein
MKTLVLGVWAVCVASVGVAAGVDDARIKSEIRKICDPVCELRSQDAAFSLLIEAYRQFQSHQIESDFEVRLKAANAMGTERGSLVIASSLTGVQTLRSFVVMLAEKERDLRLERLQTQVANFRSTYGCARRVDEEELGVTVPASIDTRKAATKLRNFDIMAPGTLASANLRTPKSIAANTVLLDAPEVEPAEDQVIESCD